MMGLMDVISSRLVGRRIMSIYDDEDSPMIGQVIECATPDEEGGVRVIRIRTAAGEISVIDPKAELVVN